MECRAEKKGADPAPMARPWADGAPPGAVRISERSRLISGVGLDPSCAPVGIPSNGSDAEGCWGRQTTRNPTLLLTLSGLLWLRIADRQFLGLLFQEPPRSSCVTHPNDFNPSKAFSKAFVGQMGHLCQSIHQVCGVGKCGKELSAQPPGMAVGEVRIPTLQTGPGFGG